MNTLSRPLYVGAGPPPPLLSNERWDLPPPRPPLPVLPVTDGGNSSPNDGMEVGDELEDEILEANWE